MTLPCTVYFFIGLEDIITLIYLKFIKDPMYFFNFLGLSMDAKNELLKYLIFQYRISRKLLSLKYPF